MPNRGIFRGLVVRFRFPPGGDSAGGGVGLSRSSARPGRYSVGGLGRASVRERTGPASTFEEASWAPGAPPMARRHQTVHRGKTPNQSKARGPPPERSTTGDHGARRRRTSAGGSLLNGRRAVARAGAGPRYGLRTWTSLPPPVFLPIGTADWTRTRRGRLGGMEPGAR